jgi:hypothetical protein
VREFGSKRLVGYIGWYRRRQVRFSDALDAITGDHPQFIVQDPPRR